LRTRCLEKLFKASEIEHIQTSAEPLLEFWVLWSIKETAYKAWQRATNSKPVFNPVAFEIISYHTSQTCIASEVKHECHLFSIKTEVNSEYIYSYINSRVHYNKVMNKGAYACFSKDLAKKHLVIEKNENQIPWLINTKTRQKNSLSITHDGRFVAFSVDKDILGR
jgi:phosphopantetheinyl transferase (holo-ACP synthase)